MTRNPTSHDGTLPRLPLRIVVGVVGHRGVDAVAIRPRVDAALAELRKKLCPEEPGRVAFTALSPLAEGADRIVAEAVLATGPEARLDVAMPLDLVEYVKTFTDKSEKSFQEFDRLLHAARRIVRLGPSTTLEAAYAAAGRYVVDRCDLLVAIHDPSRESLSGGTGETLAYAERQGCAVVRIDPTKADAELSVLEGAPSKVIARMDEFTARPRFWDAAFAATSAGQFDAHLAEIAKVAPDSVREARERLLPAYHRANVVAVVCKRRYQRAAISGYMLAALAVTVAALDPLLPEEVARIAPWVEVALLAVVVGIVVGARWQRWHERWLDYRFLAEQFRSSIYLAIAGREVARLRSPRKTIRETQRRVAYRDSAWIVRTHAGVVGGLSRLRTPGAARIRGVAKALARHWVREQLEFHTSGGPKKLKIQHALTWSGLVLFVAAIGAASLRALHVGPHALLEFLCLALPAIGGALAAIRVYGEYERSAQRSEEVLEPLAEAHDRLERAATTDELARALLEVEATLRFESEDWRVVHRFRDVEWPG